MADKLEEKALTGARLRSLINNILQNHKTLRLDFFSIIQIARLQETWQQYQFDEELTGLEDMHLAKRLIKNGGSVGYVAESCVTIYITKNGVKSSI